MVSQSVRQHQREPARSHAPGLCFNTLAPGGRSVALTHRRDEQDALIPRDRASQQVDIPAHIMTLQTPRSNQLHEAKSASRWPSPQPLGTPAPIGPTKHPGAATDRSLESTTDPGGPQPGWAPVPNGGSRPGGVSPCITEQQQGHKAGRRQLSLCTSALRGTEVSALLEPRKPPQRSSPL